MKSYLLQPHPRDNEVACHVQELMRVREHQMDIVLGAFLQQRSGAEERRDRVVRMSELSLMQELIALRHSLLPESQSFLQLAGVLFQTAIVTSCPDSCVIDSSFDFLNKDFHGSPFLHAGLSSQKIERLDTIRSLCSRKEKSRSETSADLASLLSRDQMLTVDHVQTIVAIVLLHGIVSRVSVAAGKKIEEILFILLSRLSDRYGVSSAYPPRI